MRTAPASHASMAATPRPAAPSRRACRADMSRVSFIGLVAGWSGALILVVSISAAIRFVS